MCQARAVRAAEEQTAGRGRLGRSWVSERGVGLYFSIILRPEIPAAQAPVLTLAIGLGVARGIGEVCGRQCDLRWPNDVLLNEKKVSGILVEMESDRDRVRHVIAGVGINVNNSAMPPELAPIASSLKIETGCEFLLDVVRDHVLKQNGCTMPPVTMPYDPGPMVKAPNASSTVTCVQYMGCMAPTVFCTTTGLGHSDQVDSGISTYGFWKFWMSLP